MVIWNTEQMNLLVIFWSIRICNTETRCQFLYQESKHAGIRHACDHCDKSYANEQDLKLHITAQHEGVRYACTLCESMYVRAADLKAHKKLKHGAKIEK